MQRQNMWRAPRSRHSCAKNAAPIAELLRRDAEAENAEAALADASATDMEKMSEGLRDRCNLTDPSNKKQRAE